MYNCYTTYGTFQIVLNEQNSIVENHLTNKPYCGWQGNQATQGVHNIDGTVAFTATGRNCTDWTTMNESTRFVPAGITWYAGGYPGGTVAGYGDTIMVNPTVTTTYTAVVNTCGGGSATDDVVVTVVDPTFSYSSGSYCQSDPNPAPVITQPGGTFSALPAGLVFVSTSTGTIDLPASTTGTYTVKYTISSPITCTYSQTVTINPVPAPPAPITPFVTRCGPGDVTFSVVQLPGEDINWYDAPVGGTQYPFTGGTVTTTVMVSTHFYAEAVTGGTTCTSLTRTDISVTVYPVPVITDTILAFTVCSGDTARIYPQSSVPGSVFTWTATASSPNLSGYSDGTGLSIIQKLLNSGTTFETVTYSVFATANGCNSDTVDFTVTVKPFFDVVTTPPAQTICSNTSCTIALSSGMPGTTFSWTATGSSPNVSGYSAGTGTVIAQNLVNTGTVMETVTYRVVPVAIGCIGDTGIAVVTVRPYPDLSNSPPAKSICNNTATNIILTSSIPGALFTWTAVPSSPNVTGYSDNTTNPTVFLNQTLQNTGLNIETVTYQVVPHANGCDGIQNPFTVTVYPVANVLFTPPSQTICSGQSCSIAITSGVSGATFSWTAAGSSPDVSGYSNGSGNLIQQLLTNAGFTPGTVTYTVSGTANGCPGSTASVTVTVNPVPLVTFTACNDITTLTTAQPFPLRGGIPSGGNYSGAGVNTGIFYPALAGPGPHTITYSYTNFLGCPASAPLIITVQNPLPFFCGGTLTDVRDSKQYPTVLIGTQCWMAANLDYGTPLASAQYQTDNCIPEKYCFNNNPANCTSGGGLYQWDEVMTYRNAPGIQGLCPPGWHIPAEPEWLLLFSNYINSGFAGSALKFTGYSGFDALLVGTEFMRKGWFFNGFATMIWSSAAIGTNKAWAHGMNTYNPSVSFYPSYRSNSFSARCLRD
jgi:uncharacterized protein (TIGR02145 family)